MAVRLRESVSGSRMVTHRPTAAEAAEAAELLHDRGAAREARLSDRWLGRCGDQVHRAAGRASSRRAWIQPPGSAWRSWVTPRRARARPRSQWEWAAASSCSLLSRRRRRRTRCRGAIGRRRAREWRRCGRRMPLLRIGSLVLELPLPFLRVLLRCFVCGAILVEPARRMSGAPRGLRCCSLFSSKNGLAFGRSGTQRCRCRSAGASRSRRLHIASRVGGSSRPSRG